MALNFKLHTGEPPDEGFKWAPLQEEPNSDCELGLHKFKIKTLMRNGFEERCVDCGTVRWVFPISNASFDDCKRSPIYCAWRSQ